MKDKDRVLGRLKNSMLDDKVINTESLARLIRAEILDVVSSYVEIDPLGSNIEFEFTANNLVIKTEIKAKRIKSIGRNII